MDYCGDLLVFVYMDMDANTDAEYPSELRDNYKMSRSIGRYYAILVQLFLLYVLAAYKWYSFH